MRRVYNERTSPDNESIEYKQLPDGAIDRLVLVAAGGAGALSRTACSRRGRGTLKSSTRFKGRQRSWSKGLTAVFGPGRRWVGTYLAGSVSKANGLVDATPTGMATHPGLAVPEGLIQPSLWFADVVYFPLGTELASVARSRGCVVARGGGMAVFKAVDAFEAFSGVAPDAERMLRHFTSLVTRGVTNDQRGR